MEQINFHFDPACPWAWLTSRWMARLAELGEVEVDWRLFSLALVRPDHDPAEAAGWYSGPALRLLAWARREGGSEQVGRLYTGMGRAVFTQGQRLDQPEVLDAALLSAGMDSHQRQHRLDDQTLWEEVVKDHQAAVASCEAFGVPTLILDGGAGPGIFGPVITEVPPDLEARALLQDVVRMMRRPYCFELKRDREGHPPQLAVPG